MRESNRRRHPDARRILVDYWRESKEPAPDQHAVRLWHPEQRWHPALQTRSRDSLSPSCFFFGKSRLGNGQTWIIHDEVVLEPHLRKLNRLEMKEYCSARQRQIDQGEASWEVSAHGLTAVELANRGNERPRNFRRAKRKETKRLQGKAIEVAEMVKWGLLDEAVELCPSTDTPIESASSTPPPLPADLGLGPSQQSSATETAAAASAAAITAAAALVAADDLDASEALYALSYS
ncbi:hypothetical protein E4U59_001407 [Claviceps monticola]|nr:hypothetical protein E4U59_001407 [Claviceps monticola]